MTDGPTLLVLGPREVAGRVTLLAGAGRAFACADPYDAVLEMGRRTWDAVVLAAPPSDLPALGRACRRLQKQARIVALCPPADEPDVSALAPEVLDDYLIDPPRASEVADLVRPSAPSIPAAADALALGDLSGLIESARNPALLESKVAQLVAARLGGPARWTDTASREPGAPEPLLVFEDPPRALLRDGPARPLDEPARILLSSLKQLLPALRATARRTEVLRRLSITDDLTGLYNRRYFHQLAGEVLLWSRNRDSRATLLLYDIDNFKRYNDEFGHPVGDEILREMAMLIRQTTRSQDIVARVGGEEFAVLFWESEPPRSPASRPVEHPYALADRFRRAVASHRFPSLGPKAKGVLTISGGLAFFPRDGETIEDLYRKADEALLAAKRNGKNAIRIVGPDNGAPGEPRTPNGTTPKGKP